MTATEILFRILEIIIAAFVGVGGYLVSQRVSKSTIKKQDSEGASEITEAALKLITPLNDKIDEMEKEIKRLKVFEKGVYILIAQMKRLDIVPDWEPPKLEPIKGN